jgi:hypothetical protein
LVSQVLAAEPAATNPPEPAVTFTVIAVLAGIGPGASGFGGVLLSELHDAPAAQLIVVVPNVMVNGP